MSRAGSEIREGLSKHTAILAEEAGKTVVAVNGGHRLAASGVYWRPGIVITESHLVRGAIEVSVILPDAGTIPGKVAGRAAHFIAGISRHVRIRPGSLQ